MTTAQVLFSIALGVIALFITGYAVYVAGSTMWGDRWFREAVAVATTQRPVETKVGATKVVYKGKSGQWAFVGHRISGVLVFCFLLLHIVDVSLINADTVLYDEVHELYGNILLRIFEVGLLFALLFHSLNGLRIVLVDFFPGMVRNERRLFSAVLAVTLLVGIPCAYIILKPFIDGRIL